MAGHGRLDGSKLSAVLLLRIRVWDDASSTHMDPSLSSYRLFPLFWLLRNVAIYIPFCSYVTIPDNGKEYI